MQKHLKQRLEPLTAITQIDTPQITVAKNREAVIEGCVGILEYSETTVRLNCKSMTVDVEGFDLQLTQLSNGLVCIRGTLLRMEFSEN